MKKNNTVKIIVFHEKHGDRYFSIPTQEDLEKVALKIVKERNKDEWYYFFNDKPKEPEVSLEQMNSMKEGAFKELAKSQWNDYKLLLRRLEKDIKLKELLDKVINDKDGAAALSFLKSQGDGECERFSIEETESY